MRIELLEPGLDGVTTSRGDDDGPGRSSRQWRHPHRHVVRDVLLLVECEAPDLANLSPLELCLCYDWAMREHLSASDNAITRRPRPWCVRSLGGWSDK